MRIATKTEYRGTVFDSKSEAVFARALDLAETLWAYHPPPPYHKSEHPWDFIVQVRHPHESKWTLVEYKPSAPTQVYLDNLTELMRSLPCVFESIVVWGNPWDGPHPEAPYTCSYHVYPIFCSFDGKYGWGDFIPLADNGCGLPMSWRHDPIKMLGITESIAQRAKQYRFDLREFTS